MSAVRRIRVSGLALAIACAFPAGEAAAAGTGSRASSAAPETVVAPLGGEGRLDIRGVRGEIFVQLGRPGEIRFLASPGAPGGEAPEIALRRETGRILLGPAGEGAEAEGKLEVAVPPETSVFVETSDGKVWASGLRGGLDVRGERIVVEGRGLRGGASVAVEGGEISLLHVEGDVSVESGAADVELSTIEGRVVVGASGGSVAIRGVRGEIDATTFGTALSVEEAEGALALRARGGRATLTKLGDGATMQLEGTPLSLVEASGDVEVHSDAPIEFRNCAASLRFGALGGSVRGVKNEGLLEIRSTGGGEIDVTDVAGPVGIEGDGGSIRLKDVLTALTVVAVRSDVSIVGTYGAVIVESERGAIEISRAQGDLDVTSRHGEVRLGSLSGAVRVEADGPVLEVGWARIPSEKDSSIRNSGGGATVVFGGAGGCAVEAVARLGHVESEIPSVIVSPDGAEARGPVGAGGAATVRIEAEGDVRLLAGGGAGGDPGAPER